MRRARSGPRFTGDRLPSGLSNELSGTVLKGELRLDTDALEIRTIPIDELSWPMYYGYETPHARIAR